MQTRDAAFEEQLTLQVDSLTKEFSKYKVSILYDNLLDDYAVMYNEKENYYSASTVKPAVALYYYTMASKDLIDLDEKVVFKEKYWNESIRKRIELDSMVSLRTLVYYSLRYSDNGAHKLLVEHVGYKVLNNFVKENLTIQNTFFPNSLYGNINAIDGTTLIKAVYHFIEENGELGQELKGYMTKINIMTLKLEGIEIAQKYGWWKEVFHTLGIIYDHHPYTLVVLTKHGENDEYYSVIKKINQKIANFHSDYMNKKTDYCSSKIISN